jgi:hypothetical protein
MIKRPEMATVLTPEETGNHWGQKCVNEINNKCWSLWQHLKIYSAFYTSII